MSFDWLWGSRTKHPNNFTDFIPPPPPPDAGEKDEPPKKEAGAMEAYRFDSSALERAAAAAKSLESNPNSKELLELSKQQEITKIEEFKLKTKEYEVQIGRDRAEHERKLEHDRAEQIMKLQQQRAKDSQDKLKREDQLQRERYKEQCDQQNRVNEQKVRMEEESVAKQEQMKRDTFERERKQRMEIDMEKLRAKEKAKGEVQRENHDLSLEMIRLKSKEDRETRLESLKSLGALVGSGVHSLLGDRDRVQMAVGALVGLSAGYFAAKGSLAVTFRFLEARLVQPSLVRETSRLSLTEMFKHPLNTARKIVQKFKGPEDVLHGVILKPKVEEAIRDIALETRNCRQAKGAYRNVLLHGPPGTGKTLFAKRLAVNSGMDYAIMTGGDVQKLGDKSVDAIHKLFDWSRTSRRGLILFIDEADSFLHLRHANTSDKLRDSMAAFLNNTGERNDKFMLVLTSNIPTAFDKAVINRVHERIEFGLPSLPERIQILAHYFKEYILNCAQTGRWRMKLVVGEDYSALCAQMAEMTDGLSGRELAHLVLDWQMKTTVSESAVLDKDLMFRRTMAAMENHKKALEWERLQTAQFSAALVGDIKNSSPEPLL